VDARGIRHRRSRRRPPSAAPAPAGGTNWSADGDNGEAASAVSSSGSTLSDGVGSSGKDSSSGSGSESSASSDADSTGTSVAEDQMAAEDVEDLVLAARQAMRYRAVIAPVAETSTQSFRVGSGMQAPQLCAAAKSLRQEPPRRSSHRVLRSVPAPCPQVSAQPQDEAHAGGPPVRAVSCR
jgi:hypothetical protein